MHEKLETSNNDYKNIPLDFARERGLTFSVTWPQNSKLLKFDYERIFQAQQDFEKHGTFAGHVDALVNPHQNQLCNETAIT